MAFIESLGRIQYPLWIVTLLMLAQIVRSIADLVRSDGPGSPLRTHSILVLGVLGACVGILGSLIGVRVVADVMVQAGTVSAPTAWSGVGVALGPSVAGFFLLGVAAVAWLALQYVAGRRS